MPRHRKRRRMGQLPRTKGFHPFGRGSDAAPVILALEEYEAIRLTDYENLSHEEGAGKMNVSRPTYTRIYESARNKTGIALVEGRALIIEGGSVEFVDTTWLCLDCKGTFISDTESHDCPACGSSKTINRNDCFTGTCVNCIEECFETRDARE